MATMEYEGIRPVVATRTVRYRVDTGLTSETQRLVHQVYWNALKAEGCHWLRSVEELYDINTDQRTFHMEGMVLGEEPNPQNP